MTISRRSTDKLSGRPRSAATATAQWAAAELRDVGVGKQNSLYCGDFCGEKAHHNGDKKRDGRSSRGAPETFHLRLRLPQEPTFCDRLRRRIIDCTARTIILREPAALVQEFSAKIFSRAARIRSALRRSWLRSAPHRRGGSDRPATGAAPASARGAGTRRTYGRGAGQDRALQTGSRPECTRW